MKILVAYQSKHGSTKAIAERIGATLNDSGHEADTRSMPEVSALAGYDAFVLGSAVYYGSWIREAVEFVRGNAEILARRPVWLFSSGPVGKAPPVDPKEVAELSTAVHALGHRVFYGALDRDKLSLTERIVVGAVKAPDGDFRDWHEIDGWAAVIAHDLAAAPALV